LSTGHCNHGYLSDRGTWFDVNSGIEPSVFDLAVQLEIIEAEGPAIKILGVVDYFSPE
jgi:hypothetical protein